MAAHARRASKTRPAFVAETQTMEGEHGAVVRSALAAAVENITLLTGKDHKTELERIAAQLVGGVRRTMAMLCDEPAERLAQSVDEAMERLEHELPAAVAKGGEA